MPVSVFSTENFELTRLQSDTNLIAANVTVAAGTYTAVNVTVAAPIGRVYVNSSSATVGACLTREHFAGSYGKRGHDHVYVSDRIDIDCKCEPMAEPGFQLQQCDRDHKNGLAIDVTQTGVMTASSTVPTGVPSGNFANIDDFTGAITALSSSSITLQSSVARKHDRYNQLLNASIRSSEPMHGRRQSYSLHRVGSIVSLQGLLSNTGVVTATSIDIIDISVTPADEVEGIIYPSNCNGGNNLGMILSDSTIFTSSSPFTSAGFGAGACLTLSQTTAFAIDTGILTGQAGVPVNNTGFSGVGDLLAGQTVRAKITNAATGTNGIVNATATELILRFSRLTGTVSTTAGSFIFTITDLPPYLGTTFNVPPQVITYVNATIPEGVTNAGNLTGTVSMRALYLDVNGGAQYWFQAAKVRQH